MAHGAYRLDFVNFAFQIFSKFFKGSCVAAFACAMLVALCYVISMKDISSLLFILKLRCLPNLWNTFAIVFNLYFLASVNAHDSFSNHPIQVTLLLFFAKL